MPALILFSDINIRNNFIKKFDDSFSCTEIGRIVGLGREMVRIIKKDINCKGRSRKRNYVKVICPDCKQERTIRKDQQKNNQKNYCRSCAKKNSPNNKKLMEKITKECISCGEKIIVLRKTWIRGTKKCNPCRTRETSKIKKGLASQKTIYIQYKTNAKRKNLKFNLSFEEFIKITNDNCFYCNIEPSNIKKSEYDNGDFIYNGIDRKDNTKGYDLHNSVACCKICNFAKNTLPLNEFYNWISKIHSNLQKKGVLNES